MRASLCLSISLSFLCFLLFFFVGVVPYSSLVDIAHAFILSCLQGMSLMKSEVPISCIGLETSASFTAQGMHHSFFCHPFDIESKEQEQEDEKRLPLPPTKLLLKGFLNG